MIHQPDAFTASLLAIEGIKDATIILNGPTGCKYYHAHVSDRQYPRASSFDPLTYSEEFYFGQPRIPCTYMEEEDYVNGSAEKIQRILPVIASKNNNVIAIVNSPGASLIGDYLEHSLEDAGLSERCIAIGNTGYSSSFYEGFEQTVLKLLEWMKLEKKEISLNKVNLIGLSIYHSSWDSSVEELKKILSLMDLEVEAVICAGTTIGEIRRSASVAFNIVINQEYGLNIAKWYEDEFGIPYILSPAGAPVGFDATNEWISQIATGTGANPSKALELLSYIRKKNYHKIARFHSLTGLPKGASFAVKADISIVLPLTKWLYGYLGMMPAGIEVLHNGNSKLEADLIGFLEDVGFGQSWNNFPGQETVDIVLADGHTIRNMCDRGTCKTGVEIALPSSGYVNFLPRTYIGMTGSLFLLEEILNGLRKMP